MAEDHTGGMIALIPAEAARLSVPGGDPTAQIHLTLAFLGEKVTDWAPELGDAVKGLGAKIAADFAPIQARIMGHAVWNMDKGPGGDMEPCAVYQVAGSPVLDEIRELACDGARSVIGSALFPKQHTPFLPHITAGYGIDTSAMKISGPIVLDKIRVALGNEVTDYPLTGSHRAGDPTAVSYSEGSQAMAEETVDKAKAGQAEVTRTEAGELELHWPCLVLEGMRTGDGRFIPYGSLGARGLPLPVAGQVTNDEGHKGAEVFGKITKLERHEGPAVTSKETGKPFPESTAVWEAWGVGDPESRPGKLAEKGYLTGNSADIADATVEDELADGKPQRSLINGKIGGTTLVPIPAFADGFVEVNGKRLDAQPAVEPIAASAWNLMDTAYDDDGYEVFAAPTADKRKRAEKAGKAMPGGRYPIENADDLDKAISAVGRGKGDHDEIRRHIIAAARQLGLSNRIPDNWASDGSLKKSVRASADPEVPLLEWFADPKLPSLTPLTREGRHVFGHIADWTRPHTSFSGQPVFAPHSRSDYKWFNTGAFTASDKDGTYRTVAVGRLTIGGGHADTALTHREAVRLYDDAATAWAYVAAGEDQHGIWVNGVTAEDVDDAVIRKALAHPPSGDWRPIDGSLELVAAHCVNSPGIPVPRARVASGEVMALVAAGYVAPAPDNPDVMAEHIAELTAGKIGAIIRQYFGDLSSSRDNPPLEVEHAALVLQMQQADLAAELEVPAADWQAELTHLDSDDWAALATEELKTLHIPPYMKRIEKHLMAQGTPESQAIATAVNVAKKMCATGDLNWPGKQSVNPGSRAEACAAVAQWKKDRPGAR
jgi:2'-5' RNA ligase